MVATVDGWFNDGAASPTVHSELVEACALPLAQVMALAIDCVVVFSKRLGDGSPEVRGWGT